MFRTKTKLFLASLLCLSLLTLPQDSNAAGFELQEQSGIGLGSAFAGMSTGFGDGSEIFWNPAGLAHMKGTSATVIGHVIVPSTDYNDDGSSIPALGGVPVVGNDGGDGGEAAFVPNVYFTHELIEDKAVFGLGINTPFGLATEWDDGWVGRYHALRSELLTINFNPAVGIKINDMLSVGFGATAMYVDAELTNAVDFGTIAFSTLGPATATGLGLTPQGADGKAKLQGDDWAYGVNAGFLYTPTDSLKIGAGWRSEVQTNAVGNATFTVPTAAMPLTATGAFTDTAASAAIDLPQSVAMGLHYKISDFIGVAFDARWVDWSQFDELRVQFASGQPDSVTPENWDDSWRYAIGFDVHPMDELEVRFGYSYEETPIPSAEFRTPRIPDLERHWATVGVGYELTEDINLNLSYAFIFTEDGRTANESSTGSVLNGEFEGDVNIITANINWKL